ncbi:replication initiator protein A [Leuconostoc gelidum subsp. gelidum]|uniref:replication initiator protein A n=1 Tax=Leuconostoc gelidum TaxID=1244 RepID=UPI001CC47250|nr:replication initiator protein A [Leuconostoc gelidum]MBZ5977820.1 replication initiator protein A [Leuconostoc gelidum subsp. gelidum]MBZ6001859.1 replication initiator protein A [Leuconostoc gelidum subsp. gelidum]
MTRISKQQVDTSERFYMMPKGLFENDVYHDMKMESKMAYSILKDRFKLSLENNWVDKQGNVYLYYPNIKLGEKLGVGKDKVIRIKKELQKFGLLEEERQGFNKPNRLYICNLELKNVDQTPDKPSGDKEVSKCDFRYSQNATSGILNLRVQEVVKCDSNDTELSDTELSDTETQNYFEDEENINNEASTSQNADAESNTQNTIICAELIQSNPVLRPLILENFGDLLAEQPAVMVKIIKSLMTNYQTLVTLLQEGNSKLQALAGAHGAESGLVFVLNKATTQQLDFMQNHLTDYAFFANYFAKGLTSRIQIACQISNRLSVY